MVVIQKVADLITERQFDLHLTNEEIAHRVGYSNPSLISMIKKGRTKLPIDKVIKMADALYVDRSRLMRLALNEYMPDAYYDIKNCLGEPITKNERVLLEVWRDSTDNKDPAIPENAIQGLNQVFQEVMRKEAVKS